MRKSHKLPIWALVLHVAALLNPQSEVQLWWLTFAPDYLVPHSGSQTSTAVSTSISPFAFAVRVGPAGSPVDDGDGPDQAEDGEQDDEPSSEAAEEVEEHHQQELWKLLQNTPEGKKWLKKWEKHNEGSKSQVTQRIARSFRSEQKDVHVANKNTTAERTSASSHLVQKNANPSTDASYNLAQRGTEMQMPASSKNTDGVVADVSDEARSETAAHLHLADVYAVHANTADPPDDEIEDTPNVVRARPLRELETGESDKGPHHEPRFAEVLRPSRTVPSGHHLSTEVDTAAVVVYRERPSSGSGRKREDPAATDGDLRRDARRDASTSSRRSPLRRSRGTEKVQTTSTAQSPPPAGGDQSPARRAASLSPTARVLTPMSQSSEVSRGGRRGYTGSNRRGRGGEQQSTLILYQDDPPRGHHPTHTGEARAARGRSGSRAGRALPADPPQERAGVIEAVSSPPRTQENLLGTSPKTSKRRSSSSRKPSPSPRPSVASISSRSTLSPEASPPAASPAADAESMPSALKVQPPAQVVVNSQVAKASTREGVPGRKEHIESDRNVGAGEEKASRKEVVVEDKPLPDRKSRLAPANQLALIGRGDSGSAATSRRPSFVQKFASNRGVRALALAGVGALVSSGMWTGPGDENVVSFEAGQNRPSVAGLHSSHATAGEIYSDGPSENPDFQHRNTNTYEKHGIDLDGLDDDFWRRHNLLETSHGSREGENRNTASSAAASNRFAWTDYLPNILTDGEADPLKQDLDRDLRFENGVSYADEGVAVPPQADLISDGGRIWWRSDTENCRHNKEGLATCSAAELSACRASELCSKWKMEEDARNFVPTPMTVDPTLLIGLGTTTAMLAYNMRSRTPDQAQPQAQPQTADKKPEAGVSAAGPGAEKKAAENEKSKLSCAAGGSGATAGKEEKSETNTTEDERPGDPMDVDYSASDINVLTVDTEGAAPGDAATAATCAGVDRKAGVALSIAGKSVSASTSETGAATGLPASREKILQHVPGNKEGTMTNESNKGEVQGAGTIATAASTSNFGNIARGSAAPLMQAGGIAEFSRQLQDREPIGFPVPPATPPGAFAPYSHAEDTDGTVSFLTHGNVSTSRHRNPGSSTELSSPAQSFPTTSLPSNTLAAGAAPVQTKRRRSNSRHERWKGSMEDTNTGTSVLDEMTHAPLLEAIKKGEPTPTYSPYRNRLRRGVDPYASAASRKVRNRKNQNRG